VFTLNYREYRLNKLINQAIEFYNRFHKPEAEAELLEIDGDEFKVVFKGHFCKTCGVRDWLEDLKYILLDMGVESDLVEMIEPEDPEEDFRIGIFRVKRVGESDGNDR